MTSNFEDQLNDQDLTVLPANSVPSVTIMSVSMTNEAQLQLHVTLKGYHNSVSNSQGL